MSSILGHRVARREDPLLLTDGGRFVDDLGADPRLAGAAFVTFVRSAIAHGTLQSIDVDVAAAMPGVVAVFTAESLALAPIPSPFNQAIGRGSLAIGKVRYVGEPVAVVVAETRAQAHDAADQVIVDYDPLPALIDVEVALTSDTWIYDEAGSNVVFDSRFIGMPDLSGEDFFAGCDVVVTERFVNQRVAPCPLEVRGSAAVWIDGRLIQWLSTQVAQWAREILRSANGVTADNVHVITPDVGGGFGAKATTYPEEIVLGRVAAEVGRPVRWQETRSESMVGLGHGRAQVQYATMGGTAEGRISHYRLDIIQDCGAFAELATVLGPAVTLPMASAVYDIPNIECRGVSVITNTTPVTAYRGAGRPEATAAAERIIDLYSLAIGKDPAEVRRMNLIAPFEAFRSTASGQTYDVGNYPEALDRVLAAADYCGLREEQVRRRARDDSRQLGIGVSVYVEITGGAPPLSEHARIDVLVDGSAVVFTGTSPHGQGHLTAWSMLAQEQTGIAMDEIELVWGDTDRVPLGTGTMGSRSLQLGGSAVWQAAGELVDLARSLASRLLEADPADVLLDKEVGRFHVAGTPARSLSWADLAVAAGTDQQLPAGLSIATQFSADGSTFPFGAHVAVVEVDTDTGSVTLLRHVACDDAGTMLNPTIVEGQIHGGVAQGVAQALMEEVRYDADGNPITSNLADYAFISAAELPNIEVVHMETPTFLNPLGAKGIGESGTIGSTPAIQSAVVDAVSHLGVRHIDMPCTPERVWRAIVDGQRH